MITQARRANWERIAPFLAFPPELCRVIYTTNQIEALNSKLRSAIRTRGHFPDHDAARVSSCTSRSASLTNAGTDQDPTGPQPSPPSPSTPRPNHI